MARITDLTVTNFRSYGETGLTDLPAGPVILHGRNGAGKTNLLEAVSLFSPGRGLRNAKLEEMQKRNAPSPWAVSARIDTIYGPVRIGTGRDPDKETRAIRINGEPARTRGTLAEYLSCLWLTPQMDGLFLDSAGARRRFLDRLAFAFDPGHAGRISRYENALRQRSKLLQDGPADPLWLDGLEETLAQTGAAVAAARIDCIARLQAACDRTGATGPFPRARLRAAGTVEELLQSAPALEVEEMIRYQLRASRPRDAASGGAATGPHKSDLAVDYAGKDMPAAQCSTGEQKALLIGIVLAHARLIAAERGAPPILLLDEVAAHLDDSRRAALYDILLNLGGQVWLTGTDESLFEALRGKGAFFTIGQSRASPSSVHALVN